MSLSDESRELSPVIAFPFYTAFWCLYWLVHFQLLSILLPGKNRPHTTCSEPDRQKFITEHSGEFSS